jgi:hypothetical protein
MTVGRIDLRVFPGLGRRARVRSRTPAERIVRRTSLVLAAAPEEDMMPQRLGLLIWLLVQDRLVLRRGVVCQDGLEERDADAYRAVQSWCERQPRSPLGVELWELRPLSLFVRDVFYRCAYQGRATVIAADLGRTIGLCAEWWRPCRGSARSGWFWRDGFALGLRGAGHVAKRERADGTVREEWNPAPHSPMVRIKALGVRGYAAGFAALPAYRDARAGVWVKNLRSERHEPYRGRFVDVLAGAAALDGLDTDDLAEHCEAFNLSPQPLPIATLIDVDAVQEMTGVGHATWQLALALDRDAAQW